LCSHRAGISVDAFHNAHQREPRLKTAARLGESCSKPVGRQE
jgi:hypothetical protein